MNNIKNIGVIGAGTMGNGIAHAFAQKGFEVNLIDISEISLQNGLKTISNNLDRQIKKELILESDKVSILNRIKILSDFQTGVKNCDLVIEAASENIDIKSKIFKELDQFCNPNTIFASNTSSISITYLASATNRPDKVIGMHFMNPVPIMKLIEVIKGYSTSKQTTETIIELSKSLDKIPVEVNDFPGFISNRILMPMINEAIQSLFEGVAGVEEIDNVMKLGMAHPMGPLQLADFIGLDVCLAILKVLYNGFGNPKYFPCPLLINMVQAGHYGAKSGQGFYFWNKESKDLKVAYKS